MAEYITANSLDADDLKWQYINKTDRWNVFWEVDDGDMPCPLSYDFMHFCRFIKEDTDPPHLQILENDRWACVRQCAYGRWYLIQVKANAGIEKGMSVAFELNDKMRETMKTIEGLEFGDLKLFFIDLHEVYKEKADDFINKMRWQVIKTASLDMYLFEKRVIYLDIFSAFDFIRYDKSISMKVIQYLKSVEWLFLELDKEILNDKDGLVYKLVDARCRADKKTVLINYENEEDYGLLSNRRGVNTIRLSEADLRYKEGGVNV